MNKNHESARSLYGKKISIRSFGFFFDYIFAGIKTKIIFFVSSTEPCWWSYRVNLKLDVTSSVRYQRNWKYFFSQPRAVNQEKEEKSPKKLYCANENHTQKSTSSSVDLSWNSHSKVSLPGWFGDFLFFSTQRLCATKVEFSCVVILINVHNSLSFVPVFPPSNAIKLVCGLFFLLDIERVWMDI